MPGTAAIRPEQESDPVNLIRTIIQQQSTATVTACLAWTDHDRRLCHLARGHAGHCLPMARWPRQEITAANPRWIRGAA